MKNDLEVALDEALDVYYERFGINFCIGGFGHRNYTCEEAIACIKRCLETGVPEDQELQYDPDHVY